MSNFIFIDGKITKEKLLVLNTLVQAIPFEERLVYLQGLGHFYSELLASENYLIDERDYNIYSIIQIGEQRWLGENLRYKGVTYYENPDNPNIFYGCLYDWAAMMGLSNKMNKKAKKIPEPHQGIAPKGCHIPSDKEWSQLELNLGMSEEDAFKKHSYRGNRESILLKSISGWDKEGNGTDHYTFGALPAGNYRALSYGFHTIGQHTYYWTSTNINEVHAWCRLLISTSAQIARDYIMEKYSACSCRCIVD